MEDTLRFGVELACPAAQTADGVFARWSDQIAEVAASGWPSVWLSRSPPWGPDPCTLAGALSRTPVPALLGVVAAQPGGRHPAVLARELTGLDVVSGGRAGALVRWTDGARPEAVVPVRRPDAVEDLAIGEYLAEAATVFAAVATGSLSATTVRTR